MRAESLVGLAAPLLVFLFAGFGLTGVALGVALALMLRGSVALGLLQRQPLRVRIDWPGGVRLAVSLLVAAVAGYAVGRGLKNHWLGVGGMLLLYLVLARLFKPLNVPEFGLVSRALGARARWAAGLVRKSR